VPPTPFYPRGNPLTQSTSFTDADGVCWLAYIEGVPAGRLARRRGRVTLPGRRLRFDSAAESRTTTDVPAGSPFLSDARLQRLLDAAQPVPPPPPSRRSSDVRRHPVIELASRAEELGAVLTDPLWPLRRTVDRRLALPYRLRQLVSTVFDRLLKWVEAALTARRGRTGDDRGRTGAAGAAPVGTETKPPAEMTRSTRSDPRPGPSAPGTPGE
jgi:hypothetical protein